MMAFIQQSQKSENKMGATLGACMQEGMAEVKTKQNRVAATPTLFGAMLAVQARQIEKDQ
jgi:hypothetical protein